VNLYKGICSTISIIEVIQPTRVSKVYVMSNITDLQIAVDNRLPWQQVYKVVTPNTKSSTGSIDDTIPLQTGRDICYDTSIPYTLDSQRFNSTYDHSYRTEAGSVGDVARAQFLYNFRY
jgi:hypothetical protein